MFITLFNHMGHLRIKKLYLVGPPNKVAMLVVIHKFKLTLERFGGIIFLALFNKHCSS